VVVAAVLAALLVFTQLDRMVASAVETYGSAATGTDVSLGGVGTESCRIADGQEASEKLRDLLDRD